MAAPNHDVRSSRRKPRESKPGFAAAVATGAVLAATVVGGGFLVKALGGDGDGVVQLDTSGAGAGAKAGLVDQVPVGAGQSEVPGAEAPVLSDGGADLPTIADLPDFPDLTIPGLEGPASGPGPAPGATTPGAGGSPSTPQKPATQAPGSPAGGGTSPSAPACPTLEAPVAVAVNTVYPGGGAANTVPVAGGTLRASRPAFGPCSAQVVELPISNGSAAGRLGYGAWAIVLDGATPATEWPVLAVTSSEALTSTANVAGTCPSGVTTVAVTATNKGVLNLLGIEVLGTPIASKAVTATPAAGTGPCRATAPVSVTLDGSGKGTVALSPGTWTFSIAGRELLSSTPATVVAGPADATKSVALVAK
ncbi:MAG: hypothetical protein ACT4QF_18995 [Sporichthyaceae bacterium]